MKINKLENNNGFTLVELVVTLSILAIVLAVGGSVYMQGNRMFTTTAVKNTEKYIGDSTYAYMRERLVYATKLQIIDPVNPNQEPDNTKVFKINDIKHLEFNGNDVYGNDYYGGYTVAYSVNIPKNSEGQYSKNHLELTIYVKKGDEVVYQTGSTIKNINLVPQNSSIEIKQATKPPTSELPYENPVIAFEEDTSGGIVYAPIELRQYCMEVNQKVLEYRNSNPKDKSLLPDWWEKFVNANQPMNLDFSNSNDNIRAYVLMRYYRNDQNNLVKNNDLNEWWPSFSGFDDAIIQKVDQQIEDYARKHSLSGTTLLSSFLKKPENKDLVLMCYTFRGFKKKIPTVENTTVEKEVDIIADNSSFVYARPRPTGNLHGQWEANLLYDFEEGCWYYYYRAGKAEDLSGNANNFQDVQWSYEATVPGQNKTYLQFYKDEGVIPKLGVKEKIHNPNFWIKIETK